LNTITVVFTRRRWNPVSWLIRWVMPRSRFALALSSHAIVVGPDRCYEATMLHGVRSVDHAAALRGQTTVRTIHYQVPDAAAGIAWVEAQCDGKKRYDWRGAFGLGLAPGRDWAEDDRWFCYELAAAVLRAAGRPVFANLSHVGEIALMAINPDYNS
jgi:hypothetical protein